MMEQTFSGTSKDNSADFYIEKNDGGKGYLLNIFNSDIEDADEAYVETLECDTYEDALEGGLAYRMRFNEMKPEEAIAELQAQQKYV